MGDGWGALAVGTVGDICGKVPTKGLPPRRHMAKARTPRAPFPVALRGGILVNLGCEALGSSPEEAHASQTLKEGRLYLNETFL